MFPFLIMNTVAERHGFIRIAPVSILPALSFRCSLLIITHSHAHLQHKNALSIRTKTIPLSLAKWTVSRIGQARRAPEALVDKSWIALQVTHVGPQPLGLTGNQASKLTLLNLVNVRLLQVKEEKEGTPGRPWRGYRPRFPAWT